MTKVDRVADAIRKKDSEHRGVPVLGWKYLTLPEKTKWRELADAALGASGKSRVAA